MGVTVTSGDNSAAVEAFAEALVDDLSGVTDEPTARTNLGLGTAATEDTGTASGEIPLLGVGGKFPTSMLPGNVLIYQGVWNATTNSPTLTDGTGTGGDLYRVSVAGTQNLGSGAITFAVGDYVIHNGTTWEKSDTTDAVLSVNNETGAVTGFTKNANNLSDLADAATARTNLGLGTAATRSQRSFSRRSPYMITGGIAEPFDRSLIAGGLSLTTATLHITAIPVTNGDLITDIQFQKGGTGSTTLTHSWVAVFNSAGSLLRVSNDNTGEWALNTVRTFTLDTSYTAAADGFLYVALCIVAATPGSVMSYTGASAAAQSLSPAISGVDSASAYSTPASAPATLTFSSTPSGRLHCTAIGTAAT